MDGQRHERRQYFRGKARPGRVLPVRFKTALHPAWIAAQTRDIGVGGAFIAVAPESIQAVGTSLTIELSLPHSDQVFAVPAIVRWSRADEGMGIQFVGVDIDIMLELNDYFSSLTT